MKTNTNIEEIRIKQLVYVRKQLEELRAKRMNSSLGITQNETRNNQLFAEPPDANISQWMDFDSEEEIRPVSSQQNTDQRLNDFDWENNETMFNNQEGDNIVENNYKKDEEKTQKDLPRFSHQGTQSVFDLDHEEDLEFDDLDDDGNYNPDRLENDEDLEFDERDNDGDYDLDEQENDEDLEVDFNITGGQKNFRKNESEGREALAPEEFSLF